MFTKFGRGNDPAWLNAFLADPVEVTITASTQKVLVTSSKAFGTSLDLGAFGGAQDLDLWVCSQLNGGGPLTMVGVGVLNLRAAENTRHLYTLSATSTGLAPGTYKFGLCGMSSDYSNWNFNEFSYTTALVTAQ
jgi:hypothetical protein